MGRTNQREKKDIYQCLTEEDTIVYTIPDSNRGIMNIWKFRAIDQHKITKTLDEDDFLKMYILFNEWIFQVNDEVTRRTGRLTKILKVVDFEGSNLLWDVNPTYIKRDANMNKQLQDFYPQSLGSLLCVNAPGVFNTLWDFFKPFFPKRVVEKVNLVNPQTRPDDLNYFTKYISEEHLPECYGGKLSSIPSSFGLLRFPES